MNQVLRIICLLIHLGDDLQYLLAATYIMTCNGFAFGFGDYPLTAW